MKSLLILILLIVLTGSSTTIIAQNATSTNAEVKIVKGLTIKETSALHFGTMSIPSAPVNVILTTANIRKASSPTDITLVTQSPVSENAVYSVSGSDAATYAISLPVNGTVTISNGSQQMDIVDFVARPLSTGADGTTGIMNASGIDSFTVGATLKLGNNQAFGTYTGTFVISVNYN